MVIHVISPKYIAAADIPPPRAGCAKGFQSSVEVSAVNYVGHTMAIYPHFNLSLPFLLPSLSLSPLPGVTLLQLQESNHAGNCFVNYLILTLIFITGTVHVIYPGLSHVYNMLHAKNGRTRKPIIM